MDEGLDAQGFLTPEHARGLFDRAVVAWNSERFFDAHEDWETLWHEAEGAERMWLQGLIQFAAAFHHVFHGTSSGFVKLMRSAHQKTARYAGDTHGIDFETLARGLEPWIRHAERVDGGAAISDQAPPSFPRIAYRQGVEAAPLPPESHDDDFSA